MLASKTANVEGMDVHYWEGGSGFPLLMIHGVGPGTSIQGNFGPVLEPLAERCRIVAIDLIGFGASGRKPGSPYFDIDLWIRQAEAMLSVLSKGECGVAGHSMGGALALKLAARNPRITKVLTSSSVGAPYPIPSALDRFWAATTDKSQLRAAMMEMVHDANAVTDAMIEDRYKFLATGDYAAYFSEMFAAPRQRYLDAAVVTDAEFAAIRARVLMLHGRDDKPCPPSATTMSIANKLPNADIRLLGRCGHNLPRERTAEYLEAAAALFC